MSADNDDLIADTVATSLAALPFDPFSREAAEAEIASALDKLVQTGLVRDRGAAIADAKAHLQRVLADQGLA